MPNGVQERPITGTRLAPFVISGGARIGSDEPVAAAAQKLEFTAYPNPAGETLTLQANTTAGQAWTVAIYNQVGQMVGQPKQYDTVQNQISLNLNQSGITPGVYIVRVKDGNNQLHTVKFIKSR